MNLSFLLPLSIFAVAMTSTPGPNNLMVLNSGARVGVTGSLALVAGIALGVGLQFAALGFGLGALFGAVPFFHQALGVIGGAYILWLAWKIATSGPLPVHHEARPALGFFGGAAFQWINPKAWATSISAAATYLPAQHQALQVLAGAVLLVAVSLPCVGGWAVAGVALRRALTRPRAALLFNIGMAILLIAATLPAMLQVLLDHDGV